MSGVDFSRYPSPEWNGPQSVSEALSAAQTAIDQPSAMAAYNKLLYAIGNNHAGTYYPVATAVVSALAPFLASGQSWPRVVALEVLVDLTCSFQPERGFEYMVLSTGSSCRTAEALHCVIAEIAPLLQSLKNSSVCQASERELAAEILKTLEAS